ncbi:MAG: right-handed parallel beta-helix repeat-containing protein, partial [Nanoarchaeota archaeon]|nr:right-handed parallel beta-helix repeat-containing protein [Nanoarchaeota archaeon]
MKRGIILLIFIVLLASLVSVSAEYYEGGCSDSDLIPFLGGRNCVEIRQSDCNGLPDRCQILSSSNTYYLLMSDIVSSTAGFEITGNNIVLDLNEHTILFANNSLLNFVNNGFEDSAPCSAGSCNSVSGWDFSGANAASVTNSFPAGTGYWVNGELENQVLRINSPSTSQSILSDPIPVEAGRRYALSYLVQDIGTIRAGTYVNVVGGVTWSMCTSLGVPISTSTETDHWGATANTGYSTCTFVPTSNSIQVQITTGSASGEVYIDAIEIAPSNNYWGSTPYYDGVVIGGSGNHVTNGKVIQGQGNSHNTEAVRVYGTSSNSEVSNLNISVYGPDSYNIFVSPGASESSMHGNDIYHKVNRTFFAHEGITYGNAIAIGTAKGASCSSLNNMEFYNNSIYESASGIHLYGEFSNASIHDNYINVDHSNAIHSYAIGASRGSGVCTIGESYIYNNFINNSRGGGIFFEAADHISVYDNYIEVRDGDQEEFTGLWSVKGIHVRYSSRNLTIYNNTLVGYGGYNVSSPGEMIDLALLRVGSNVAHSDSIYIFNNTLIARVNEGLGGSAFSSMVNTRESLFVVALDLATDQDPAVVDKYIYDNYIESDHIPIDIGGTHYAGGHNVYLDSNIISRPASAISEFMSVYYGYSGGEGASNVNFLNTTGINGADVHDITYSISGPRDLDIDWYLDVNVFDGGNPADASVYVESLQQPSTNFNDNTGGDGTARFTLTEQHIGGAGNSPSITTYAPYN